MFQPATYLSPVVAAFASGHPVPACVALGTTYPSIFGQLTFAQHKACMSYLQQATGLPRAACHVALAAVTSTAKLDRVGFALRTA